MMGGHIKAITSSKLQLKIKTEEASENLSSMLIEPPKTNQGTKLVIVLSERGTYQVIRRNLFMTATKIIHE